MAFYAMTDLGYDINPLAINAKGQIAGCKGKGLGAIKYSGGVLEHLGGAWAVGTAINARGDVVGVDGGPGIPYHAFLYEGGGVVMDLRPRLAPLHLAQSHAIGISDAGDIIGFGVTAAAPSKGRYWFLKRGGVPIFVDKIQGHPLKQIWAMSGTGLVAAQIDVAGRLLGAVIKPTTPHLALLPYLPGLVVEPWSVDDEGDTAGVVATAVGETHESAYRSIGGVFRTIGPAGFGRSGLGRGVSAASAVGSVPVHPPDGPPYQHAFISEGDAFVDLNTVTVPHEGFKLTQANAVNEDGWIACAADAHAFNLAHGYTGSFWGGQHGVLLRPFPPGAPVGPIPVEPAFPDAGAGGAAAAGRPDAAPSRPAFGRRELLREIFRRPRM